MELVNNFSILHVWAGRRLVEWATAVIYVWMYVFVYSVTLSIADRAAGLDKKIGVGKKLGRKSVRGQEIKFLPSILEQLQAASNTMTPLLVDSLWHRENMGGMTEWIKNFGLLQKIVLKQLSKDKSNIDFRVLFKWQNRFILL